jgi:hypothetical protein
LLIGLNSGFFGFFSAVPCYDGNTAQRNRRSAPKSEKKKNNFRARRIFLGVCVFAFCSIVSLARLVSFPQYFLVVTRFFLFLKAQKRAEIMKRSKEKKLVNALLAME